MNTYIGEKKTYIDTAVELTEKYTGLKSPQLIRYYALLAMVKGKDVTLKDVHDAWSMNMNFKESNPPYCYGHHHLSIVPFVLLSKETQDKDQQYVDAIRRVAEELSI